MFTPFYRSNDTENRKMNPNGHGLGLYISKNICKALGGDLKVSSKQGQGATFTMTMKIETARTDDFISEKLLQPI